MDPQMQAMMAGLQQGQGQGGSTTPNAYQPQGRAADRGTICGGLKVLVDQLNSYGSLLNGQGLTQLANDLYKASYQTNSVCEKLEKGMTPGEPAPGQQQL
jgi:hypothetical protein